jgi:YVTN family beta-propeller protein
MRLFRMNFSQSRVRLVQAGAVFAAAALVAGCGNNYRPVVTPVNPSGPPAQPQSLAVVVTAPSTSNSSCPSPNAGIATVIDYAGDSILATACTGPNPSAFTLDETGYSGYTYNSDHTITNIPVSTTMQTKNVTTTTLLSNALPLNFFAPSAGLWAADLCATFPINASCVSGGLLTQVPGADVFSGSPATQVNALPLASTNPIINTPVMVVGPGLSGKRYFALSQSLVTSANPYPTGLECNTPPYSAVTQNGAVTPIEVSSYTTDTPIPTGKCPVYAVESSDSARLFVLNRGSDTITVINAIYGTLDSCTPFLSQTGQTVTCHPTLPLSTSAGLTGTNVPATAGPVYAEYNAAKNLLVIADYDGGTITVIDVTLDEYGNDYNTYSNPSCTVGGVYSYANCGTITGGFGTTYTIPVGKNPASVTVLNDGSRAYTANQTDQTVTVVDLSSYTVEKTLAVTGYPRTVVSTQNSTYGKVYVASPNTDFLTIISTGGSNPDTIDTTVLLQGDIVDVRVGTQNGTSGNSNNESRIPGYGQPCNLPGPASLASLAACQAQP